MFKQLASFLSVVVLAASFMSSSLASDTGAASLNTQAERAIAQALADGHEVSVTASELVSAIQGINSASFVSQSVDDTFLASSNNKRYKCSATRWYAGHGLTINYWADANVSGGKITEITSTGWNYSWTTWWPTFDAVVTGNSSASIQGGGSRIKVRFDGQVKYWFAGIPISTKAINLSCVEKCLST